ncbi:hypothetical protein BST81_01400 [Leptolyngbya sp. 'hensonii']|uniref:ATP-binding protein n=1 Tax=Leptolyngbya sp. 'hensonii' TaxID=1922337 RepID=UPI0009501E6B|nr:ATP-binding protein [Leptolyngbya sp. 'hensonii']OLP20216.1 hypothetical protein BST81_01400 [Leptolyngbya sp. 'hensonii']
MAQNPFEPHSLIGRQGELQQLSQILAEDGDVLIAGVPGIGRRTLIRAAAYQVGARVLEIDCLRATDPIRFLTLLAESLMTVFSQEQELTIIQQWIAHQPLGLEQRPGEALQLTWNLFAGGEWTLFQILLSLPQHLAEVLDCRVVMVFQNFPHIRSWDRHGKWEAYLRQEIQCQSRVSYALIATIAESWVQDSTLQVLSLAPLADQDLWDWVESTLALKGLTFDPEGQALQLFLSFVQGHFGDALALLRRICLNRRMGDSLQSMGAGLIQAHQVYQSALELVEDLSVTFESLILLLPPSQVRVLESLALDPTDSPHSREYIRRHQLSRGGGLQGALTSLEQKGLVYGPKHGYRIALPMLAFWLKYRLA